MKKVILVCAFGLAVLSTKAQQWSGAGTSTGLIYRTGNVIVGGSTIQGSYGSESVLQLQNPAGSVFSMRAGTAALDLYLGTTWLNFNAVNAPISLSTNYASRIKILTDGNVGIGTPLTTNPNGYKLAVNGKIGAKEVQVENTSATWADYVFKPDYKLMPLTEVETFIQNNQHLPEIPSADEVKENGHRLGEMDVLLLKKVEELTLYVIGQDKKIKAQTDIIERQQKLLTALEEKLKTLSIDEATKK
jgi:hypothetical protein